MNSSIQGVCILVIFWQACVQPSLSTELNGHTGLLTADVSAFTYNICHDPTDRRCVINGDFTWKLMQDTRKENYLIETEILEVTRCQNTVHRLNNQSLADRVDIRIEQSHSENYYTRTYLNMARLVYLSEHLHSKMRPLIEECCLSFPDHIFDRLKYRLLNKWFILQDKCDEPIAQEKCDVTAEIKYDWPNTCDDARDTIYLLLKYAQDILQTSFPVINMTISKSE